MKKAPNLSAIFAELEKLFEPYATTLNITKTVAQSGDLEKPTIQALGKKDVSMCGRKAQPTWVAGLIQQKNFVGFYLMSLYTHPQEILIKNEAVAKMKKGKSCFNITKITPEIITELKRLLAQAVQVYQGNGLL